MELEVFRVDVRVRGQHIYKDIWYAVVGEVLWCGWWSGWYAVVGEVCEREPPGYYAVAVKKENSACLIFAHKATRENILTAKITQTTVWHLTLDCYTMQ